jgi:hypothetical protein
MACFFGVNSMDLWWRQKPVNQFQGAPFRLNDVMSLKRFRAIDSYWPKGVPGDDINKHFEGKEIGSYDCFVQEKDGKKFLIHCHKEDK